MSIVDKMLKWWDSGVVSLRPAVMTTWKVTLKNGEVAEVTATRMKTTTDPLLGEKVIQFWNGSVLVVQWPTLWIVKYEAE